MQLPLALDEMSEPEPDFSVVRGSLADLRQGHPRHAALIGEMVSPVAAPGARIAVGDLLT